MLRRLIYFGNAVLRKHALPVKEVTEEIKQIVNDLLETMHANNGVGLAAPQVGIPLRIFISALEGIDEQGYSIVKPEVYINPKIISVSKKEDVKQEGCLSFPGIYEEISRPIKITIEALDAEGKPFKHEVSGWKARNILHENDHLNGVLFIDRIGSIRRKQIEPLLKRIKKKYS